MYFKDHKDFKPNLTPKQILQNGAFGGGYFRNISSSVTNKTYKNYWKKFPSDWFKDLPKNYYCSDVYQKNINKYKVHSGATLGKHDPFGLLYWESKNWINPQNPFGWFEWYSSFYLGKRSDDDLRQIKRWKNFCGENGRFKLRLMNNIYLKNGKFDDFSISPKIRQNLMHWGYELTSKDYEDYVFVNKSKK